MPLFPRPFDSLCAIFFSLLVFACTHPSVTAAIDLASPVTRTYDIADLFDPLPPDAPRIWQERAIIRLLADFALPTRHDTTTPKISLAHGLLTVTDTPAFHTGVASLLDRLRTLSAAERASPFRTLVTRAHDIGPLIRDRDTLSSAPPHYSPDRANKLIAAIVDNVAPDSWQRLDTPPGAFPRPALIRVYEDQLIVTQTPINLLAIEGLLDRIGDLKLLFVQIDARLVLLPGPIEQIVPDLPPVAESTHPASRFRFLDREHLAHLLHIPAIQSAPAVSCPQRRVLEDLPVTLAHTTPVTYLHDFVRRNGRLEPETATLDHGLTLSLRATTSPDRRYVALSGKVQVLAVTRLRTEPLPDDPTHVLGTQIPVTQTLTVPIPLPEQGASSLVSPPTPFLLIQRAAQRTLLTTRVSVPDGDTLLIPLGLTTYDPDTSRSRTTSRHAYLLLRPKILLYHEDLDCRPSHLPRLQGPPNSSPAASPA